jgi:hypothetical protein
MDLQWSTTDIAFREEVRTFLDESLTSELRESGHIARYADLTRG